MMDPTEPLAAELRLFITALDFVGTFVFALSGGLAAAKRGLDLFGVLVLSMVAATAGGVLRDVLIGAVPPATLVDWRYLAISLTAGIIAFRPFAILDRLKGSVQLFDAAGLAIFAVSGAQKALAYGLEPAMAALLGMLTGIGGGIARDMMLNEIPTVLRAELYAVAALAGAGTVVAGESLHLPWTVTTVAGVVLCLGLRFGSIYFGWHLPTSTRTKPADGEGK